MESVHTHFHSLVRYIYIYIYILGVPSFVLTGRCMGVVACVHGLILSTSTKMLSSLSDFLLVLI